MEIYHGSDAHKTGKIAYKLCDDDYIFERRSILYQCHSDKINTNFDAGFTSLIRKNVIKRIALGKYQFTKEGYDLFSKLCPGVTKEKKVEQAKTPDIKNLEHRIIILEHAVSSLIKKK